MTGATSISASTSNASNHSARKSHAVAAVIHFDRGEKPIENHRQCKRQIHAIYCRHRQMYRFGGGGSKWQNSCFGSCLLLNQRQQTSRRHHGKAIPKLLYYALHVSWGDAPGKEVDVDKTRPTPGCALDQAQSARGIECQTEVLVDRQARALVPGGGATARAAEDAAQTMGGEQLLQIGIEKLHAKPAAAIQNLEQRELHGLHVLGSELEKGCALLSGQM